MFSIFKTKYLLKDLIPDNYIDIHNHLLPGIDDGSKTVEQTNKLITRMKELNISGAIATPHTFYGLWDNTASSIQNAFTIATVNNTSASSFLKGYSSEYLLDATLIERINKERLLCLVDNYILVELPLFSNPINLYEMLFELKIKDYKIIIAHPERYLYFHNNLEKFSKLKKSGVYFQLNLLSLTGFYGKEIQKISERLLENDLYDFTGTDIHRESHVDELISKPIAFSDKNKIGDLLKKNTVFNSH
jgi:protein-tyrosine phosphatase